MDEQGKIVGVPRVGATGFGQSSENPVVPPRQNGWMSAPSGSARAEVLITVKAAPEIGRTHGETVCVAGVRLDVHPPELIRLFPVRWSWFFSGAHPKYQRIAVDIVHHDRDQRPESHRPDLDGVEILDDLGRGRPRAEVLNTVAQVTMCDLVAEKGWSRRSLGVVVPADIDGFVIEDAPNVSRKADACRPRLALR